MKKCNSCGYPNKDNANLCFKCNHTYFTQIKPWYKITYWSIIGCVMIPVLLFITLAIIVAIVNPFLAMIMCAIFSCILLLIAFSSKDGRYIIGGLFLVILIMGSYSAFIDTQLKKIPLPNSSLPASTEATSRSSNLLDGYTPICGKCEAGLDVYIQGVAGYDNDPPKYEFTIINPLVEINGERWIEVKYKDGSTDYVSRDTVVFSNLYYIRK